MKYQAAFIVPIGARKILEDDGWEFDSAVRFPEGIKDYLIKSMGLKFIENFHGVERYSDGSLNMSIIFDDENKIESFYFQLYGDSLKRLKGLFQSSIIFLEAELFVPG